MVLFQTSNKWSHFPGTHSSSALVSLTGSIETSKSFNKTTMAVSTDVDLMTTTATPAKGKNRGTGVAWNHSFQTIMHILHMHIFFSHLRIFCTSVRIFFMRVYVKSYINYQCFTDCGSELPWYCKIVRVICKAMKIHYFCEKCECA